VLRSAEPSTEFERVNDGRAGVRPGHQRLFHMYVLGPPGLDELQRGGVTFVAFDEKYLDYRSGGVVSKAGRVRDFLKSQPDEAFFSVDVAEALEEHQDLD